MIADSLISRLLPSGKLPATIGDDVDLSTQVGWSVVFVYPYTGRPGIQDPPNWDAIKGAHGSTPQALAFSDTYDDFQKLDVKVFGLSLCSAEWQLEFANRNALAFSLLSDEAGQFSRLLGLAKFQTGGRDFLVRTTLFVFNGLIRYAYFPDPHSDAATSLNWLRAQI